METSGKIIGAKRYIPSESIAELPGEIRATIEKAVEALRPYGPPTYNVLRIEEPLQRIAFLSYPELGWVPFPRLDSSWRFDVASSQVTYRSYAESLNPPILHRTELLLPDSNPNKERCRMLTSDCERLGLFDQPTTIGYSKQWDALIQQRGYELVGFELRPIGNAIDTPSDLVADPSNESVEILRHLTALSRTGLSAPVQSLIRDGLLDSARSFFDYGCGKGDDLSSLRASGYSGSGWDPYYRPDSERQRADIVNLGFVINVIEDREERIAALQGAFELAKGVLAVAAMLSRNEPVAGEAYRDGVRTGRNTFQKYYTQAELQQFIESVLDEDAYPAGPGIFYVFRDSALEQSYLLQRTSDRSRVARSRLAAITVVRAPRPERIAAPKKSESADALAYLERLWTHVLELGRPPDIDETPDPAIATEYFGSPKRALGACLTGHDPKALERAAAGRRDDILVMLALRFFERRRRFTQLERRLQRDIKAFFGSYQMAEAKAQQLLFSVKDTGVIQAACQQASAAGLGWLDSDHSLQSHTSLVERLPAALRVYIGCATALAGNLNSYDLVKAHIQSGKVTLMSFDDFAGSPVPALLSRIKVRLRDQDFDVFTYGNEYPPKVLYWKSRYINEEFLHYAEQVQFDESLEALGVLDLTGHGVTRSELNRALSQARYELDGFQLRRSQSIPRLDEPCGAHFVYRDFIECGETWHRLRVDNLPRSPESYTALCDLARYILDPVIDYFGAIKLTYGFASPPLTKQIPRRIAPSLDQHAAHEHRRDGQLINPRRGAAIDFVVEYEDMSGVVDWIAAHTPFDRLYYYGPDRPIHVSYGPNHSREIVDVMLNSEGRPIPRRRTSTSQRTLDPSLRMQEPR
jgi:DNA phosphorothioation-associated putative methyltransferase